MKIMTRYILKEMFGPTMLGLLFYTSIILMKQLFDLAGLIIRQSLTLGTVMHLLGLSMPHIIVLTIPMSLLFGILIADLGAQESLQIAVAPDKVFDAFIKSPSIGGKIMRECSREFLLDFASVLA